MVSVPQGLSELARRTIARLPEAPQSFVCDALTLSIYRPLARVARFAEGARLEVASFPLVFSRPGFLQHAHGSRERFGTPLGKGFRAEPTRSERMMIDAGLAQAHFSERPPYRCAVGIKS